MFALYIGACKCANSKCVLRRKKDDRQTDTQTDSKLTVLNSLTQLVGLGL